MPIKYSKKDYRYYLVSTVIYHQVINENNKQKTKNKKGDTTINLFLFVFNKFLKISIFTIQNFKSIKSLQFYTFYANRYNFYTFILILYKKCLTKIKGMSWFYYNLFLKMFIFRMYIVLVPTLFRIYKISYGRFWL